MSMFKIEKNITMPSHSKHVYPFERMEIGDSFVYPDSFNHRVWGGYFHF